jgi:hypothetical protein
MFTWLGKWSWFPALVLSLTCASCASPLPGPLLPVTQVASPQPVARRTLALSTLAEITLPPDQTPVTPQPYPYPYPTLDPGPYPPPVLTVTAEAYWSYWFTQTALPSPTPEPTWTPAPIPTITPTAELPVVRVSCSSDGKVSTCFDHLLGMRFEYLSDWGEIEPRIWHGGYAGYGYGYSFSNSAIPREYQLAAGGRSRDFSEGREAFITDYSGVPGELDCTQEYFEPGLCQQIAPQIILIYEFPKSERVCDAGPGTIFQPRAMIKINLPDNPVINGFVFTSRFLAPGVQAELDRILNPSLVPGPPLRCDEAHRAQYDARVQEIIETIRAGDLDMESEKNLRWFVRLARSIQLK